MKVIILVNETYTVDMFDASLGEAYAHRTNVRLHIDLCKANVWNVLSVCPVLEKYRELSSKYLEHTRIIVQNTTSARFIRCAMMFIRPEKPVYIGIASRTPPPFSRIFC